MSALIDLCEAARPHPDWAKLRGLPYAELSPLIDWVQKPFREQPPGVVLKGLWFGLFNPCPDGRTPIADTLRVRVGAVRPWTRTTTAGRSAHDWWPDARVR